MKLSESKAKLAWKYFYDLSAQPRESKHEEKALEWLKWWARDNGLKFSQDSTGNILVEVAPSDGFENAPSVCLQAHVDMVCEKTPQSNHDFRSDPLELREVDGWVMATDTTLGADNGMGIALALAAATDSECSHPKLELLFTVDEETGLTGANGIEPDFFKSKQLINLDSEDDYLIIGCAGGQECELYLETHWQSIEGDYSTFEITISGLKGGHSGTDINSKRANAIKMLAKTLRALNDAGVKFSLSTINGGSARNAIARDAQALVVIENSSVDLAKEVVGKVNIDFSNEFASNENNMQVELISKECRELKVISNKDYQKIIETLLAIPHGATQFCSDFDGVVQTSNNLAIVKTDLEGDTIEIHTLQRSCDMKELDKISNLVASIGELVGARVDILGRYPSWQPSKKSALLKKCKEVYRDLHGKDAQVNIIHAGLECGLIGDKFDELDMISFGPIIHNAHSPQEKLSIKSVEDNWQFLKNLLRSRK